MSASEPELSVLTTLRSGNICPKCEDDLILCGCNLDLTETTVYPINEVPADAIRIALKVIRTLRNYSLGPEYFNAAGAVTLSHAHQVLVKLTEQVLKKK